MCAKIISLINKKGGVAKTSSTGALASICAAVGLKVLCVDLDPQCNITELLTQESNHEFNVGTLMMMDEQLLEDKAYQYVQKTKYENIDIIAGNEDLDIIGEKMILKYAAVNSIGQLDMPINAQTKLTTIFNVLQNDYDLILIDNTPYFNIITKNGLSASNGVLIPIETDGYSYRGLTKLLKKIIEVKSQVNEKLDIIGIFITRANPRTTVFKNLFEAFKDELGDKLLNTYIRQDNKVKESNTTFIPLYNYAPKAMATRDYANLVLEIGLLDKEAENQLREIIGEEE